MSLQIGKGLFRIFVIFYVGWVIYHPFKYYNSYVGTRDAYIAINDNFKAGYEKFSKIAKDEGNEKEFLENKLEIERLDDELKETLEGWKQANIDGIWDKLGVMFVGPFIYGIPIAILYWILRFILKGFVKTETS